MNDGAADMTGLLHRLAADGWVYDRIQDVAGAHEVYRRLGRHLVTQEGNGWVLDVGGGTGRTRQVLDRQSRYVCLDLEEAKLTQFQRRATGGLPVRGDATLLPFQTASLDLAVCVNVSHHLTGLQFEAVLDETRRVLRPTGRFVFLDAILSERWIGRTLWGLDRGSYPRSPAALRAAVARRFHIQGDEQFRLWHEYLLLVSHPQPSPAPI